MRAQDRYADMLHLPCPGPRTRPRMPRGDRAAQFAPFAALVGYDAVVSETGRLTEAKRLLSEDALALLERIPTEVLDEFRKPKAARREAGRD